jgi:replicative DNA helicase
MSVSEVSSHEREFERTPPHDMAAEQCVLGSMLISQTAVAEVIELVQPHDFYRPAHQTVFDRVLDLYGRGDPVDAITIKDELLKRGELSRIGDAPYLHTLVASVPTAANAGYYAKIVQEKAILRRLVEVGTRIAQLGYSTDGADADDLLDRAQAEVYAVADKRTGEDYAPLSDIMPGALDEIEAIGSRGGQMVGVPTGFTDLDALTNGLHPGQMVIIAARPAIGKALALDTPLPTPGGWTTMGEVRVGDELLGADGRPTTVTAATPVLRDRTCYEVEFNDGTVIVADAAHQWLTETRAERRAGRDDSFGEQGRRASVKTTREIADTLRCATSDHRLNHSVPVARPARLDQADLPRSPYALGAGLGRADGPRHIPVAYLRASEDQRRELLAGLLDAGGHVSAQGTVRFSAADQRLAADTLELVLSLGYRATMRSTGPRHQVVFTPADKVFRLTEKLLRQTTRADPRTLRRYITDVRLVPSVPVRCVQVDNEECLYLASRAWIPTHNSTLALDLARAAAIRHQLATVVFSLEMGRNEITMRLLSAEARVALHAMRSGSMNDEDWTRLARRMSEVAEAPLFIDDSPNMSMMEIRAKCRRLKQQHDLRLVIIDYLQLMQSGKRVESRQVEVSEFSRSLKLLAKELGVPVIALSQLNRGPEQRTDKKPMVSDLRESGCLTAGTRILRADTGAEVTLGELLAGGERDVPVWSLDDNLRYVPRTMTHAFSSGRKEVFRVRLASGREVNATANHPFMTYDGWRALDTLLPGSRVAVPRHVPAPIQTAELPDAEVELLAHLVSGSSVTRQPFVPESVFSLPKRQLAVFLRQLWATGGRVQWDEDTGLARIHYASSSRRLVDDVARLLLRFNVMTRVEVVRAGTGYRLHVHGADDQLRFLEDIEERSAIAERAERGLRLAKGDVSAVPHEVWDRMRSALGVRRELAAATATRGSGSAPSEPAPSRQRLGAVARILDDAELEMLATNDVFWDEVASIESIGVQEVYDATVLGTHNFVADGISLHNSIEQDADMVILLHREDAYEKESPRAGEADLIVAKHRNGPTATVTVAFQGHYSRFVDMAH